MPLDDAALDRALASAERAADRARAEIMPRFRKVGFETKPDGSPVTEADLAAERAIRDELARAFPDFALLGEEFGGEAPDPATPRWIIDPIDGTIAFSRGIPLFSTLIGLVVDGEPVVGLIDLPGLGDRLVGRRGGACLRNGVPVRCSAAQRLDEAIVSHGDGFCFEQAGQLGMLERMAREIPMLRGYTDAFGHALVLSGAVGAMVDFGLKPWDAAATQALIGLAGGVCHVRPEPGGKLGVIFGSPPLVEQLVAMLEG